MVQLSVCFYRGFIKWNNKNEFIIKIYSKIFGGLIKNVYFCIVLKNYRQ